MDEKPIFISEEFRSGFLLRIKKVNGKVVSTWLEISDRNRELSTTLNSLTNVISQLGLQSEISISNPPNPPKPPEPPQSNDYRYYCVACNYNFPAFKDQPDRQKLFCVKCDRWQLHEKRIRPRN